MLCLFPWLQNDVQRLEDVMLFCTYVIAVIFDSETKKGEEEGIAILDMWLTICVVPRGRC